MRRPRHLSPEEKALWDQVAKSTDPINRLAPSENRSAPKIKSPETPRSTSVSLPRFRVGERVDRSGDHDLLPSLSQQLRAAPVQMDQKSYGKLKRGKLKPEARIDLHGMTLAQAHPALIGFILRSASSGHRLVLVITGKGKDRDEGGPIPTKLGVLRHQVPQWLAMAPMSSLVLQVSEAHIRHGGGGAYYVYLRRAR